MCLLLCQVRDTKMIDKYCMISFGFAFIDHRDHLSSLFTRNHLKNILTR